MLSTTLTTTSSNTDSNSDSSSFRELFQQQQHELKRRRKKNSANTSSGGRRSSSSACRPHHHNQLQLRYSLTPQPSSKSHYKAAGFQRDYLYNNAAPLLTTENINRANPGGLYKDSSSSVNRGGKLPDEVPVLSKYNQNSLAFSSRHQQLIVDSSDVSSANFGCSELDMCSDLASTLKLQKKKFIKCVLREDVDLLKALVCQNNLISIRDKHRNTLLHIACGFGRLKSAQTLLKMCPILIDQLDDKGHNPCDVAIKHGQLEVVKWLLFTTNRLTSDMTRSSSPSSVANNRRSCLHLAAKHGENEVLKYILAEMNRQQMSLDIQDSNGNTAAHLAAKYNNLDCLQVCDLRILSFQLTSSFKMIF